jgi:inner membrane protein
MCHFILLLPVLALPVFWVFSLSIAIPLYAASMVASIVLYLLLIKGMRMPRLNGVDEMVGRTGRVVRVDARRIMLLVDGEYWMADGDTADFKLCDEALINAIDGLRLKVSSPNTATVKGASSCKA